MSLGGTNTFSFSLGGSAYLFGVLSWYLCIHTYMHACMHAYLPTYLPTYVHKCTRTYIYIYIYTNTYVYTHRHTDTDTHTHTHIYIYIPAYNRCICPYRTMQVGNVKLHPTPQPRPFRQSEEERLFYKINTYQDLRGECLRSTMIYPCWLMIGWLIEIYPST